MKPSRLKVEQCEGKVEQNIFSLYVINLTFFDLQKLFQTFETHPARSDQKYQSPNCANMAYIFENYMSVETFWCKIWIDTCTILRIGLIFTTVAPIFD